MRQLVCWTLATLYSIARLNRPTQAEIAEFNLTGWDSPDWFDGTTNPENQARWAKWVNASWGLDLRSHSADSFILYDTAFGITQGGTDGSVTLKDYPANTSSPGKTLSYSLWRTCRGEFSAAGNFLDTLVGDYCDSIYPPDPTPSPSPSPEPPTSSSTEPEPPSSSSEEPPSSSSEPEPEPTPPVGVQFSQYHSYRAGLIVGRKDGSNNVIGLESVVMFKTGSASAEQTYIDCGTAWGGTLPDTGTITIASTDTDHVHKIDEYDEIVFGLNYRLKGSQTLFNYGEPGAIIYFTVPSWACTEGVTWTMTVQITSPDNIAWSFTTNANLNAVDYYTEGIWTQLGVIYPEYDSGITFSYSKYKFGPPITADFTASATVSVNCNVSGLDDNGGAAGDDTYWTSFGSSGSRRITLPRAKNITDKKLDFTLSFIPYYAAGGSTVYGRLLFNTSISLEGYVFPEQLKSMDKLDWCVYTPQSDLVCPNMVYIYTAGDTTTTEFYVKFARSKDTSAIDTKLEIPLEKVKGKRSREPRPEISVR